MSRNRVVIVVLALIAVLYVISLGLGFRLNVESPSLPSRSEVKESWVSLLGDPLSIFAPPNLLKCNGQAVGEPFELTHRESECKVKVPGPGSERTEKAKLQVLTKGVAVYERSNSASATPECKTEAELKGALRVKWEYLPDGRERRTPPCWRERKAGELMEIKVTGDGGTLTLACEGCRGRDPRFVRLRLGASTE